MSYNEEQQHKSRVVVETPNARREVVRSETARVPERSGVSTGMVAALVIAAVALVTILFLFLMNNRDDTANTNARVAAQQPTPVPQTTIIQQPAPVQPPQPPVIIQQAPPATQTQPIIVPPATSTTSSSSTTGTGSTRTSKTGVDDTTIQSNIDKKLVDDPALSSLGVTATVVNGHVTLTGTVNTPDQKRQVERLVNSVKGVLKVDNQIIVSGGTNP